MKNILIVISFIFILPACKQRSTETSFITAGEMIQVDSLPASAPYFTSDTNDNIVLSWARQLNDSVYVFCYAVSADGGQTFQPAVQIPGSENLQAHAENLPKLIFKPSGEIIALWGAANPGEKNKYAGLVFYSQSFDNGKNWTQPRRLVEDPDGFDQRYYDVALLATGEVAVIWLDNRKATDVKGSALYFATTHGKSGFSAGRRILDGCCPCCRTELYADKDNSFHILYRGIINGTTRDMLHSVSVDGGKTFTNPELISNDGWVIDGCPHTGPSMTGNSDGLHFAWFTGSESPGCYYTNLDSFSNAFSPRVRISEKGSHPQIITTGGQDLLLTWDEPVITNGKYSRRIGVALRRQYTDLFERSFITSDTLEASYPVITPIGNNQAGLAYTIKKGRESYVCFQKLSWQPAPH